MDRLGPEYELAYTEDRNADHRGVRRPPNSYSLGRIGTSLEMARAYQNADAMLFPTRLEGLPLAALEAQACGLPVIASRSSSLPEVVADGTTGSLCPQDDVDAFATAARRLAGDVQLWRKMRENAREQAKRHFSIETMIDRYVSVYCRCLESE
jgi:glycosyltransferase involved in cell wall biosynthesis